MKTIRLALLLSLVGLVTMACIRFQVAFTVNEDGSGTVRYQIAIKDDMMELAGEDLDVSEEVGDLPEGAEVQDYSEDGYTGVVVTVPIADFSDMEKVRTALGGVSESMDSEDSPFDTVSIDEEEDGAWHFSMLMTPFSDESEDGLSVDELGEGLATLLLGDAWFRVLVKLPGELAEHNADRIEDGVLVWELDFMATEEREMTARSIPEGGLPIVPIVVGIVGIVVLVALVSLAYVRRRR